MKSYSLLLLLAAAISSPVSAAPPLRGFTVGGLGPETLEAAKKPWNANIVRWQFNSLTHIVDREKITPQAALDQILAKLPAQLDQAKELGITVVLCIPQSALTIADPSLDNKQQTGQFWEDADGKNLALWIDAWKKIATLCASRTDQPVWFDLMNEPLDWNQMPSFPKQWPVWAQRLIDEIRLIDQTHPIVIETGPGGLCWGFKTFPMLKDANLIYSVHQYQPHEYSHQGVNDIRHTDLAKTFPDRQKGWPGIFDGGVHWDKALIEKELQPVVDFQKRNPGVRIYVGEFSVIRWAPDGAKYVRENIEIFEKHGWDWTYHALHEYSGWSPEYDENFTTPEAATKSTGLTRRGAVLQEFMKFNSP